MGLAGLDTVDCSIELTGVSKILSDDKKEDGFNIEVRKILPNVLKRKWRMALE